MQKKDKLKLQEKTKAYKTYIHSNKICFLRLLFDLSFFSKRFYPFDFLISCDILDKGHIFLFKNLSIMKFFPQITAQAHCDIPCGIYEPTPAKLAAKTVVRMVQQIKELELPKDLDKDTIFQYINSVTRRIKTKEDHAELCKKELEILWSDFFKKEHLEKFANLHEIFWQAVKLCSRNKQEVNTDVAQKLVDAVDEIAKIFYEVKGVPERFKAYREITDQVF